jgi:hypothetical protein
MAEHDGEGWRTITSHVVRVAEVLARLRRDTGTFIHLDIEPEPDCSLENSDETIAFFEQWLLPVGAPALATTLGIPIAEAEATIRDHIRLCFDCCHFAVEFEDPAVALDRFQAAGIKIGRVQLSSALRVPFSQDPADAAAALRTVERFADTTYLHQVVERGSGDLRHFPDLGDAMQAAQAHVHAAKEWRIHFHVPLFARDYEAFGSTQDYVAHVLDLARSRRFTRHLEIETYTWDVLPPGLKVDVGESIAREYEWVLRELSGRSDTQ